MSGERMSGPSPLPSPRVELGSSPLPRYRSTFGAFSEDLARHKGGEYDVQGDVATSWLILLPPLVGGFGEGSFRSFYFFGNMNFFFHLRGWVAWGTFISMGCAVGGEDIHTAMLSIHLEAEPKVGCILSEPRV